LGAPPVASEEDKEKIIKGETEEQKNKPIEID